MKRVTDVKVLYQVKNASCTWFCACGKDGWWKSCSAGKKNYGWWLKKRQTWDEMERGYRKWYVCKRFKKWCSRPSCMETWLQNQLTSSAYCAWKLKSFHCCCSLTTWKSLFFTFTFKPFSIRVFFCPTFIYFHPAISKQQQTISIKKFLYTIFFTFFCNFLTTTIKRGLRTKPWWLQFFFDRLQSVFTDVLIVYFFLWSFTVSFFLIVYSQFLQMF